MMDGLKASTEFLLYFGHEKERNFFESWPLRFSKPMGYF